MDRKSVTEETKSNDNLILLFQLHLYILKLESLQGFIFYTATNMYINSHIHIRAEKYVVVMVPKL